MAPKSPTATSAQRNLALASWYGKSRPLETIGGVEQTGQGTQPLAECCARRGRRPSWRTLSAAGAFGPRLRRWFAVPSAASGSFAATSASPMTMYARTGRRPGAATAAAAKRRCLLCFAAGERRDGLTDLHEDENVAVHRRGVAARPAEPRPPTVEQPTISPR